MIFDLLYLDGHSLMALPYEERRAQLLELGLNGPTWQTPAHHVGDGAALLEASRAQGLEGIVAKRLDCPYPPGRRSSDWVKVKNVRRADVVIGGWLPGEGGRSGRLGALVVGFYEDGELRYAGRVGHRLHARPSSPGSATLLDGARARGQPVRAAASRRRRRASSSRRSSPRSTTPSGRTRARCASPPTRACATTSRRRTSGPPTRSSSRSRRCSC